uniref:Acyl_transf_3 domain-containing protein n=1 Tax=Panagrellus redivivus TaxID=6233 RepID=A0A7E4W8B3_PANRE
MNVYNSLKRVFRTDIQCLRALAIFGVLGFHLWPQVFPLGYLGVDIFFVISGYLMTLILSRVSTHGLTFTAILDFYNRRAKRILPPYVLTIFVTVLVCQFVLTRSDFVDFKEDAIWALGIATNVKDIIKKQQYFDSTHLYKFLLHTWSLGLEMQYYVFAPMLLRVIAVNPRPLLLISVISSISWTAQCLIADDTISFGFVGCRLWQFMFGTAAFYISQTPGNGYTFLVREELEVEKATDKTWRWNTVTYTMIVFSLVSVVMFPFVNETTIQYTSNGTRLFATLLTGTAIALGPNAMMFSVTTVVSNTLVYIGDISYSVYLVHWPLGTGNLTVLLTGNSYAMRIYQSLLDFGKHKIKKLFVTSTNTCVIHKKLADDKTYCRDVAEKLKLTLAEIIPDIVIVNQRMFETTAFKIPLIDAENDIASELLRKDWAMISNYTKKIIIVEPAGGLPPEQDILKPLRLNEADLSVYAVPLEQYKAEVDPGWDRVLKSINNCPKCKAVGIRDHFCDDKSCAVYDTESRMSLYCDVNHHAPTAVKRYMPSIVREIEL